MSLKTRILVIFSIVITLYVIADYSLQRMLIFPSFVSLEREEAKKDLERSTEAIRREIHHLDLLSRDWAAWDDTYEFVLDKNKGYIESNLVDSSFYDNNLNLIYCINNEREVVWGKIIDLEEEETIQLSDFPLDVFGNDHPLLAFDNNESPYESSVKGIFMTERGPMLISSRLILTSDNEGPVRGFFMMGKFLSDDFINTLKEQTRVDFQLWPVQDVTLPQSEKIFLKHLTPFEPIFIKELNKEILHIYTSLPDIKGAPALLLRADIARDITAKGHDALRFTLFSIIAIGLLFLLALLILIHIGISGPISKLTQYIITTGKTRKLPAELPLSRTDEIGTLTKEFSKMFTQISKSKIELEKQNEELHALDKIKDNIVRDVSHELKTPLVKLQTQLEFLTLFLKKHQLDGKYSKVLNEMQLAIDRQERVIHNILDLSRLESGARQYKNEPMQLDHLLEKVLTDYQYMLQTHEFSIESDFKPTKIYSDSDMLFHVFSNLINNSIKYRSHIAPKLKIVIEETNEDVIVKVEDNGVGLTTEENEMVFEKFYQVSAVHEGCGVGLTIAKMIIEGLQGEIWLESAGRDLGTTALVKLPFKPEP